VSSARPLIPVHPGLFIVPGTRGQDGLIDAADYEAVAPFNWCAVRPGKAARVVYLQRRGRGADGRSTIIRLHSVVAARMGLDPSKEVDHKNRRGYDCRRSNLREATHGQNAQNAPVHATNKSGFNGVCRAGNSTKWRAYIKRDGRQVNLGQFDSLEDAVAARRRAALETYGEFGRP
jgi:hypothetical protein